MSVPTAIGSTFFTWDSGILSIPRQSATAHGSALMLAARMTLAQRFGFPVTVKAKDEIEFGSCANDLAGTTPRPRPHTHRNYVVRRLPGQGGPKKKPRAERG